MIRSMAIAVCTLFAAATLAGCCCGDAGNSASTKCTAKVKYTGKSKKEPFYGKGSGKDEAAAKENACWDYCFSADSELEAKFAIWQDGPAGKAYAKRAKKYKKKVTIKRVIIDDNTSFEAPFMSCVSACQKNAAKKSKGLRFTDVSCGKK